jgi:prepilin-type processing-associated H-X9-DG protein
VSNNKPDNKPQDHQISQTSRWTRRARWVSALGIISLVLSVTCWFSALAIIPGAIAVILGKRALKKMAEGEATELDFNLMRRGLKLGAWGTAIWVMVCLVILFLGWIIGAVEENKSARLCMNNEKQIYDALQLYADDSDGKLPQVAHWAEDVDKYSHNVNLFYCHSHWLRTHKRYERYGSSSGEAVAKNSLGVATRVRDYGLNAALAGKRLSDLANPSEVVLVYETSQLAVSPNGDAANVIRPGLHNSGNYFLFADGHVKWYEDGKMPNFVPKWKEAAIGITSSKRPSVEASKLAFGNPINIFAYERNELRIKQTCAFGFIRDCNQ